MLIQIVEDDRALSDGIVLALGEQGTEFIQCTGVKSAKQVYGEKCPELIILDVNLPDGSGYDYLKWVRSQADTPVLMLTANDMEMDEVMGLGLGADDYMTKPFSLAVLRARIRVLLRRRQQRQTYRFLWTVFSLILAALFLRRMGMRYPSVKMSRSCSGCSWKTREGFCPGRSLWTGFGQTVRSMWMKMPSLLQ